VREFLLTQIFVRYVTELSAGDLCAENFFGRVQRFGRTSIEVKAHLSFGTS
jgi:hypothetical protein